MSAVAKKSSVRGTMAARSGARQTTIGGTPRQHPALPAAPAAPLPPVPSVTASSRVAIPHRRAEPRVEPPPDPPSRVPARTEPRPPPSLRSQGKAPPRVEPLVRQSQARGRRAETFDEPAAPAPSKMAELRSTIARLQQRLDVLEPNAARFDESCERHELASDLLDEAIALIDRPDGVLNRRRLKSALEQARKVLG